MKTSTSGPSLGAPNGRSSNDLSSWMFRARGLSWVVWMFLRVTVQQNQTLLVSLLLHVYCNSRRGDCSVLSVEAWDVFRVVSARKELKIFGDEKGWIFGILIWKVVYFMPALPLRKYYITRATRIRITTCSLKMMWSQLWINIWQVKAWLQRSKMLCSLPLRR